MWTHQQRPQVRQQIQFGLDVTGDGGVPVGHLPLDGNAGEVNSHLEIFKIWARTVPKGKLLYIADTKLDAPATHLANSARKGQFLSGGAPRSYGPTKSSARWNVGSTI
ncbi:hypothetical protein V5E97_31845 [Singulisphaera sp. Ch08]|uniref:Transposase n=1 Tax=Singulisphaera sp. Ch08 TaxID=3120278 RepID=A0AAU7CCC0_9BACT